MRVLSVLSVLSLLLFSAMTSVTRAGIVLELVPTGPYVADGVNDFNGTFDLRIKELVAPLSSPTAQISTIWFSFEEQTNNPAFTIGESIQRDLVTEIFDGLPDKTTDPVNLLDQPGVFIANNDYANLFQIAVGNVIATVPFSVAAGNTGTYTVTLVDSVYYPDGSDTTIPVTFTGSIEVTAVPEPTSIAFVAIASCSGAIGVLRRNRSKNSANANSITG